MKKVVTLSGFALILTLSVSVSAGTLSYEGKSTLDAINSGKKCSATWSSESSKSGQDTKVFDVRELNGKTQYKVFHSPEHGNIWTWDFRIYNIQCN